MATIRIKYTRDKGQELVLGFEQYIFGVVASEIGNAPLEACKAQAVAARTTALPYLLEDRPIEDTGIQAFRYERLDTQKYPNAFYGASDTAGEVLMYNGALLSPCSFSSSNGGKTTSSQERWGGYRAYLIAQDDPYDYAVTKGKKTGHGVGMSQLGAKEMARLGFSYRDILSFYYPETELKGVEKSMATETVKASYQVEKFKYMADNKWDYVAGGASKGAVDCSGAFTYWYKQAGGYMYHGSNTMWRKYSTEKGKIGEIDLYPGMAVYKWRNDGKEPAEYQDDGIGNFYHVGQYIGNGQVVEAKGIRYGVVYSCISQWSHASRLKNTVYDTDEDGANNQSTTSSFPIEGSVKTAGGKLRVRVSPVSGAVLGQLTNGTSVTIIGETNGWYMINYKGTTGYISGDYVKISSGWKIICTIDDEDDKESVVSYIKSKGYNPVIEKIGG